jgi:hypothetical protein
MMGERQTTRPTRVAVVAACLAALAGGSAAPASGEPPPILPPYGEPGPDLDNTNPHTMQCDAKGGHVIKNMPLPNVDGEGSGPYTVSLGTVQLMYSDYCQTNWILTTLKDNVPGQVIEQRIGNDQSNAGTDIATDQSSRAFTNQVYAPDNAPVDWEVTIWRSRTIVGHTTGSCGGPTKFCDQTRPN